MSPPNINFDVGNLPGSSNENNNEPITFTGFVKEYQTPIISIILLAAAFVFVKFYKRKNY